MCIRDRSSDDDDDDVEEDYDGRHGRMAHDVELGLVSVHGYTQTTVDSLAKQPKSLSRHWQLARRGASTPVVLQTKMDDVSVS